ncbi:NnrS family protein [Magnetovibrio sp.]|uniref:NnrS family protein n=1 Tax=Magnetovibrio sp. TaxID=2024836 RepID=UPI002F94D795
MSATPTIRIEDPFAEQPEIQPSFALFNYGFRPFFLLAGLFGVVSVPLWVGLYSAHIDLNLLAAPYLWHGHEMLFGYTAAAIAGFFLTVVPNWTKVKARKGNILIALSALWLLGRVAFWAQGYLPYSLVIVADMLFLVGFTALVLRPLLDPQHRRQFVFVPILVALIAANAMTHLGIVGFDGLGVDWGAHGLTLGLDAIIVLIAVMGGRVTPSFTSSFLGHGDPNIKVRQNAQLDRLVMNATWGMLVINQLAPDHPVAGGVTLFVAALHAARLSGWQGWRTLSNPILWVLHLGYVWLIVGLALRGLSGFDLLAAPDALHALTIGAVGTFTMGVMTRASLGHTGRVIKAAPMIVAAYVLISVATVTRLAAAVWPEYAVELVMVSGVAWTVAFAAFVVIYAPILMRPRIDGRPG